MQNLDIRFEVKAANLKLWQVADKLGMTDSVFSRKLRKELSDDEKNQIRTVIKKLSVRWIRVSHG